MKNKVLGLVVRSYGSPYLLASTWSPGSATLPWDEGHMCNASLSSQQQMLISVSLSLLTWCPLLNLWKSSFTHYRNHPPCGIKNFLNVPNSLLMVRPIDLVSAPVSGTTLIPQFYIPHITPYCSPSVLFIRCCCAPVSHFTISPSPTSFSWLTLHRWHLSAAILNSLPPIFVSFLRSSPLTQPFY